MKNFSFSLLSTFLIVWSFSMPATGQGLLLDDAAYDELARRPNYGNAGSKAENKLLSETPKVDLRPFCPRPQHQGAIGSCTGWSTGYGAMSIMQAMEKGWSGQTDKITANALSALYIYNQVKIGSCEGGAYISKAVQMAKVEGSVPSSSFDLFKNDCTKLPTETDSLAAIPNRIKDYMTLFGTKASATVKLEKTKLSLAEYKPVVIGMLLRKNFQNCTATPPYWAPELGDTTFFGAHAMVVVGYDDGREAFEILNSWGDNWGDGGFIWVKYADFARFCTYAIQVVPRAASGKQQQRVRGALEAQIPYYDTNNDLLFRADPYQRAGHYYIPTFGAKTTGSLQQWQISHITPGSYLYAFSVDPRRGVKVHWPRDGQLDAKYEGKNESAIISIENVGLFLPSEYGALQFNQKGSEYLVFLISRSPIADLNDILYRLKRQRKGDFMQQLKAVLGSRFVDPGPLGFTRDAIAFSTPLGEEDVLPVVVKMEVR